MPYANNKGVKIYYEVEGQGPPLLLGHGFGGTWRNWSRMGYTQGLNNDYRLIMLDTRGCGASDKPHEEEAYDFRLLVSDLVAILDDLNIQKASYFGYSMGGIIGFRIPIFAPGRFSSLILGGAAYPILGNEDEEDENRITIQRRLEKAFDEGPDRPMEAYLAEIEKGQGPTTAEYRVATLANDPWALMAANRAFRFAKSRKSDEVLPLVDLPCLIFAGESDPRCPKAKECAARMPHATFFALPGLHHNQTLQRSDLILPHVKKFLAEVNA